MKIGQDVQVLNFGWSLNNYSLSQDVCAAYLDIFNENKHTCDRRVIETERRKKLQDNLIHVLSFFTKKNSQEQKQISFGNL